MAKTTTTTTTATMTVLARRLWRLLRKALQWARKGGALNRRLVADLRVVCNRLTGHRGRYDELHYKECELSFAETPTFQLKMFKPTFRCIDPAVDSDDDRHYEYEYDKDDDDKNSDRHYEYELDKDDDDKNSDALYLEYDRENYECRSKCEDDDDDKSSDALYREYDQENYECRSGREDGGVDRKADEFIAKFYRQVRLQRELSMQKRQQNSAKKMQ